MAFAFVSVGAIGGDEASQSVDMTFTVNIEPPMCKLDNATLDVDFGEFQIFDIVQGNVKKTVGFNFTDCTNVNNVKISFSGDKIDTNNNVIRNKSGAGYASGVVIGLYDDKEKEFSLKSYKIYWLTIQLRLIFVLRLRCLKTAAMQP